VSASSGPTQSELTLVKDSLRYGYSGDVSSLCGKRVEIINLQNYKSVNVTVADDCPTCDNENSIDMSHGAFTVIADPNLGNIPIKWRFLS
jgi:expansin (peptidoglycan-binding protein)